MLRGILVAATAAFISFAPANAVNLVVNGGFETGDFTGWEQVNDTSFTGVDDGTGFPVFEGSYRND